MTNLQEHIIGTLIENERGLKSFIYSKVKNQTITSDLFQDVSFKALVHYNSVTDKDKALSWLYSLSRNRVNDYFRQNQRILNDNILDDKTQHESNDLELEKCLRSFISELPKKYRVPLILSDIQGFSQLEIATQLGLSHAGSRSRVQRARKMLKQRFIDTCKAKENKKGLSSPECNHHHCNSNLTTSC